MFIWLCQVFVAARGISIASLRIFRCSTQTLQLWRVGSVCVTRVGSLWCMGTGECGFSSYSTQAELLCGLWDIGFWTRDQTYVICIAKKILHHWTISYGFHIFFFLRLHSVFIFIFGCTEFVVHRLSLAVVSRGYSFWGAPAPHCCGFSCGGTWALGMWASVLVARGLLCAASVV